MWREESAALQLTLNRNRIRIAQIDIVSLCRSFVKCLSVFVNSTMTAGDIDVDLNEFDHHLNDQHFVDHHLNSTMTTSTTRTVGDTDGDLLELAGYIDVDLFELDQYLNDQHFDDSARALLFYGICAFLCCAL